MDEFEKEIKKLEKSGWYHILTDECFGTDHEYERWDHPQDDDQWAEVCRHCKTVRYHDGIPGG